MYNPEDSLSHGKTQAMKGRLFTAYSEIFRNSVKMIPSTKISQTILEFGKPLVSQLPQDHTKEEFEASIKLVIMVWNAVVIDTWNANNNFERDLLQRISGEPKGFQLVIKRLIKRKKKKFGNDPRGVGHYWVRQGDGEFIFGCEARLGVENVPAKGPVQ